MDDRKTERSFWLAKRMPGIPRDVVSGAFGPGVCTPTIGIPDVENKVFVRG